MADPQAAESSSQSTYLFSDLLALARAAWVARMADRLAARGHGGYRRSDALTMRVLRAGPQPVGRLAERLGVSRQAARKAVDGLVDRGLATAQRSAHDARVVEVALSPSGRTYAVAVVSVLTELNREMVSGVQAEDMRAADRVLRAAIGSTGPLGAMAQRVAPPGQADGRVETNVPVEPTGQRGTRRWLRV